MKPLVAEKVLFNVFCYLWNKKLRNLYHSEHGYLTGSFLSLKQRHKNNSFIDCPHRNVYPNGMVEDYSLVELLVAISQTSKVLRDWCNVKITMSCSIGSRITLSGFYMGNYQYASSPKPVTVVYQDLKTDPFGLWIYFPKNNISIPGFLNSSRSIETSSNYGTRLIRVYPCRLIRHIISVYSPNINIQTSQADAPEQLLFEWLFLSNITLRNDRLFELLVPRSDENTYNSLSCQWVALHYHQYYDVYGVLLDLVNDRRKLIFLPLDMVYNCIRVFDLRMGMRKLLSPPKKQSLSSFLLNDPSVSDGEKLSRIIRKLVTKFSQDALPNLWLPGYSFRLWNCITGQTGVSSTSSASKSAPDDFLSVEEDVTIEPVTIVYSGSKSIRWGKIGNWKIKQSLHFILSTLFGNQNFHQWPERLSICVDTKRWYDQILWQSWTQTRFHVVTNPFLMGIQKVNQFLFLLDNINNQPQKSMMIERKMQYPNETEDGDKYFDGQPSYLYHKFDRWKTRLEVMFYMKEQRMVCLKPEGTEGQFLCPTAWLKAFCEEVPSPTRLVSGLSEFDGIRVGDTVHWFEPYPPHIERITQVSYGYDLSLCSIEEKWYLPLTIDTVELGQWEEVKFSSANSRTGGIAGDNYRMSGTFGSQNKNNPLHSGRRKVPRALINNSDRVNEYFTVTPTKVFNYNVNRYCILEHSPLHYDSYDDAKEMNPELIYEEFVREKRLRKSFSYKQYRELYDESVIDIDPSEKTQEDIEIEMEKEKEYEEQWMNDYVDRSTFAEIRDIFVYNAQRKTTLREQRDWKILAGSTCYFCLNDKKIIMATIQYFTPSRKVVVKWTVQNDTRLIERSMEASNFFSLYRMYVPESEIPFSKLNELVLPTESIDQILFVPSNKSSCRRQVLDYLAYMYNDVLCRR